MSKKKDNRCILITRKTRLQELVERFNTWPQAKFYLEHNQVETGDYLEEHDQYQRCLLQAENILKRNYRFLSLERSFLPNFRFNPSDIVVVIGQDGLVANTLKYLDGQQLIAVNPDPDRWDGKLLPFEIADLPSVVEQVENDRVLSQTITFAEAATNDGQRILAVNDLFIGPKSHKSVLYNLSWGGKQEFQSSSGIIISTGFGSSGWFQSVLAGALGVTGERSHMLQQGFGWDDQRLQFAVREPFPSQNTGTSIVFGEVTPDRKLVLESYTPENGVIFSDGIEQDFLPFNSGCVTTIGISKTRGLLVTA